MTSTELPPHDQPASGSASSDPVHELEETVRRLSALVLHADHLAERMDPGTPGLLPGPRAQRVARLRQAVALGRSALQQAVQDDADTVRDPSAVSPERRTPGDRRQRDRRG